jgi:hypothetical protein
MTITPEIEAGIKRELTHAQAGNLKVIEKWRKDMSVPNSSVIGMLGWDAASVVMAEFSYGQYTMTLGRVGREEYSLLQNHWRSSSSSQFHNAVESAKAEAASRLVREFQRWGEQGSYYGLFEGTPRSEQTGRLVL